MIKRVLLLVALSCALTFQLFGDELGLRGDGKTKKVDYLQIAAAVQHGQAKSITVERGVDVSVDFKDKARKDVRAAYPDERTLRDLILDAERNKVAVYTNPPPSQSMGMALLMTMLPVLVLLAVGAFLVSRSPGMGQIFRSKFSAEEDASTTTFKDVAGVEEAKEELAEIVEFLEEPERFVKLGAKVPRGVLLVGPPGTGKTMMAKAAAGESGSAFFSLSGSDFVEMFAGLGANRVRDLFKKAREQAPAIIFIDEIDAVGRSRAAETSGGAGQEHEQTLTQLLTEMDGFRAGEAVLVMAATNRPEVLDPALLRPGRFDRQILVDRPDVAGRQEILRVHAAGKPIDADLVERIAKQTPGFTGAELANLLNEAALIAARRRLGRIDESCVSAALDRVVAGLERRSLVMSDEERTITAYHEVGHALCAHFTDHPTPVRKISIVSRGRALGFTLSIPERDRLLETRASLISRMAMMLGGRAAELEVFGRATSGAASDLEKVTQLAFQMVTRFGMSERVGPRMISSTADAGYLGDGGAGMLQCSPQMAAIVEDEMRAIIDEAESVAASIVAERRDDLERVTARLDEAETIEEAEFLALLEGEPPVQPGKA